MADTDKLAAEMLAGLDAKDAVWQSQCDGWVQSASDLDQPITAETEAILRRNSYGGAASVIRALQATITALEAENKRLREAVDEAYEAAAIVAVATDLRPSEGWTLQYADAWETGVLDASRAIASNIRRVRDISRNRRETP